MSIISSKVAIVSVGMSCQTSYQIRNNIDFIKEYLGLSDVCISAHPFDWLVCPPANAVDLIDSNFFPGSSDELEKRRSAGQDVVCWLPKGIYYWHDFNQPVDIATDFDRVKSKYEHLNRKWKILQNCERVIFVLSNTQNNLPQLSRGVGGFDWSFSSSSIKKVQERLTQLLPDSKVEGLVVTYSDRSDTGIMDGAWPVYFLEKDESGWQGDIAQWRRVFHDYLRNSEDSCGNAKPSGSTD